MNAIKATLISSILLISNHLISQDLTMTTGEVEFSKFAAKNGRYAGTYAIEGGGARTFYIYAGKKKEVMMDVYDFKSDGSFDSKVEGVTNLNDIASKFNIEVQYDEEQNWSTNEDVLLIRTDIVGRLVVDKGRIAKEYDNSFNPPFFTGYGWSSNDKLKPDVRMRPAGFIPIGQTVKGVEMTDGGIKKVVKGTNEETLLMESASVMVAGIVTEKISLKAANNLYNNNRLACQTFSGKGLVLQDEKFHILPFASAHISTNNIKDDLGILYGTLQAPSSVKEANQYNMKDDDRKFMQYVRVNKDGDMVESVKFKSSSSRGMFKLFGHGDDAYIFGFINDGHDGYYRWDVGKISHLEITKISGGKVAENHLISIEDIENQMQGPKGEKTKFNLNSKAAQGDFKFNEMYDLSNGDLLVTGETPKEYFAIQVTSGGELRGYYQVNRIDEAYLKYDYQIINQGDNVLLVIMEQPHEVTQGAHYSATETHRRVARIDDVFTKGLVMRIDVKNATLSNQVEIGGKKNLMLGSQPCRMSDDGSEIYFTSTDKKKMLFIHSLK